MSSESKERVRDARFLARVRKASIKQLYKMLDDNSATSAPRWERIAIRRAIAKIEPKPISWVLGLSEIVLDVHQMSRRHRDSFEETLNRIGFGDDEAA